MKKNQLQITNLKMLLLITVMLFSVSWVQAVTYYLTSTGAGSAQTPGNWNTVTDGTGTAATTFTTAGDVFIVPTNISGVVSGTMTFGLGSGTKTNLTLNILGSLTINNGVTLTLAQSNTSLTTLNVESGGSIIFAASAANQLAGTTSGNGTAAKNIFNLNSGATLITANASGISAATGTSSINTTGLTANLNTGANYEFNGTAQSTSGLPTTVNNLTLSGSGLKTIGTVTVSNMFTLGGTATYSALPTYGANIKLRYNSSTSRTVGTEWPATFTGASNEVIIGGTGVVTLNSSKTTRQITVAPGAKFTNSAVQTITNFTIESDATGTGTFLNSGTFVPTDPANVQQYLSGARNWYMSTPVNGGTMPIGGYRYNETLFTNYWETVSTGGTMTDARGYIVVPTTVGNVNFSGALNTGAKSITLTHTPGAFRPGFNLIGNPYPSYLDVATPVDANEDLEKTIWYRTTYSSNNSLYTFETYSILLDEGTNLSGRGDVTGIVAPMQAFWLKANVGPTNLNLTDTYRSHAGVTANPLRVKAKANAVNQTLRLEVSNGSNIDQTIIAFNENASDALDIYDSEKWSNNNVAIPEIFTSVSGKELVINGMSTSDPVEFVNVGFRTTDPTVKTYTITLSKMNNFAPGTEIILYDGVTANFLTLGDSYSFLSGPVNDPSRFTLIIRAPGAITAINDNNTGDVKIISNEKNQISIFVNTALNSDASVSIYNLTGQLVKNQAIITSRTQIEVQKGIYLVRVTNAGTSTTAKVIIQ